MSHLAVDITVPHQMIARDIRLASGKLARDAVTIKRVWLFNYKWIAGPADAMDGHGLSRDQLLALYERLESLTVLVPRYTDESHEPVEVVFNVDWKEQPIKREPYRVYTLKITLLEV